MLKKIIFIQILFFSLVSFSQVKKTCNKKTTTYDINTISKKCTKKKTKEEVKEVAKTRTITPRSFVRRKKVIVKKEAVQQLNAIKSAVDLVKINTETTDVNNLELSKTNNTIEKLPFSLVEEKPVFAKCVDEKVSEQGKCFREQIIKHVQKHFKYPKDSYEKGIQGRVLIQFVIDENGNITNIIARGPKNGSELVNEGIRIIKEIPKFVSPGKISGNPVKVKHGIPINFKINK